MKQIWVKRFFLYVKRKVHNFSYHKAIVFLVCLVLSSFLWILSSLEKRYTSRISVPVKYIDFPKDRQLSGILPQNFDLMVDAYGYTLLSYKLRLAFSPIQISVSELVDNALERRNKYRYSVSTVAHKEEIEKQISNEIRIISIKPDSLVFNFNKIISKKIQVKPDLKLNFENEYYLENKPFASPDSIILSGPKNILDTLKFVSTIYRNYTGLSHSVEETIAIQPIPGIKSEIKEIKLTIPVEQNTEVTFEVPIIVLNKPEGIIFKTFPGKVKVTCRIGLSKYKKLDYNSFRATINYEKISSNNAQLPVTFESLAKVEMSANYSPKEVEFILEHEK
jgi:YbbR domain-containing protein